MGRVCLLAILCVTWASSLGAQGESGYSLEVITLWIGKARMSPERLWERYLSKRGLGFELTADVEASLRQIGADDRTIATLRRAKVVMTAMPVGVAPAPPIPPPRDAELPPTPPITLPPTAPHEPPPKPHYSRADLLPVYLGRTVTLRTYAEMAHLRSGGGDVRDRALIHNGYSVPLHSDSLPISAVMYGLLIGMPGYTAVEINLYLQQKNLKIGYFGFTYEPFLPLGASGFRLILGATPLIGLASQYVGDVPQAFAVDNNRTISVRNWIYGGDAKAGLAYHPAPGMQVFAEWHGRAMATMGRSVILPGNEIIEFSPPWSKFALAGSAVRIGLGWR